MITSGMTEGLKWVIPINTNQSPTYKFPVHQDKNHANKSKKFQKKKKKAHRKKKKKTEETHYGSFSEDARHNAISNHSLVRKKKFSSNVVNTQRKL